MKNRVGAVIVTLSSSGTIGRRNGFVLKSKQRRLAPARCHFFHRLDFASPHKQRIIEVVDRGTNMPGQKIKYLANLWTGRTTLHLQRQMLFAR